MKKSVLAGIMGVILTCSIVGCSKEKDKPSPQDDLTPTAVVTQEPTPEPTEAATPTPAERLTYVNMTFDDVEDGADVPDVAGEGAGFKVVKDENGNGWAVSKNPEDWAAMFFGTPGPDGNEIYLKDFCIETKMLLPSNNKGLSNDGGIPMFVAAEGRYDAAIAFAGENSTINLWKAGNTDGGPIATNNKNEFPDRGWVADFTLEMDKEYVYTIIGKYRADEDENTYVTLYMFIDDKLVIEHEVPYWAGGFGLRGWQSDIRYDYIKVSDVPDVYPDGVAR